MSDRRLQLDARSLRLNLYATQTLLLLFALVVSGWRNGWLHLFHQFPPSDWRYLLLALVVAAGIALISIGMEHFLPARWQDDGELSRKLFTGLSVPAAFLLCVYVGLGEELLFRGVIQPIVGNGWTSLIFASIHFRYIHKPILLLTVFATSLVLGWLYQYSQGLIVPVMTHALIDFFLALYIRSRFHAERSD